MAQLLESDLRRAILCDRGSSVVRLPDGPTLANECPGDCLAHLLGYHGMYATPLRTARGWRTPTRGDWGKGWPDLTLISPRRQRIVFAELKAEDGRLAPEQEAVIMSMRAAGLEAWLWRPSDLDNGTIYRILA